MKKRLTAVLLVLFFSFTLVNFKAFAAPIDDVKTLLQYYYVDEVSQDVLNAETVEDALKALGDPYTQYFTKEEFNDFINSINNSFSGIGIQIEKVDEGVKAMTVFEGSGAKDAGIKAGDIIIEADGTSLAGMQTEQAVKLIRGPEGTTVNLKIKRGSEILEFTVTRKKIVLPTVDYKIINNVAHIAISSFGEDTDEKFKEIINKVGNVDGYIIDLRNNPGGYLDTAINLGGYFVGPKNIIIVKAKEDSQAIPSEMNELLKGKKVIFLVNENSASASEVLSGAIKDYKRGLLVGNKTFGKGTVQTFISLSDESVLKFTIQKFYSPLDKPINKVGVSPNVLVKDAKMQQDIALMLLSKSKSADKRGYFRVKIAGQYYEVKKSILNHKNYYDAFMYLLNHNYIQEYQDGAKERYVRIANVKRVIEKLATDKAYLVRTKVKGKYIYNIKYRELAAIKKGA
ncbi:S41 family peptidase [Caloramator mitchellensis]|nr:S41 family peptidase [Caloramator mitchellensis]